MHEPVKDDEHWPPSLECRLLRLREVDGLCRKILSQIPGAEGHHVADIPGSLADKIAACDCATLYNIMRASLLRLIGEAIVPPAPRGSSGRAGLDAHEP